MDKITIIANEKLYEKHIEIIKSPLELQRIHFYKNTLPHFSYESRKETDTHIYWSSVDKRAMFEHGRFFYVRKSLGGVTYDRKKRTAKIWFGQKYITLNYFIKQDCFLLLAPWVLDKTSESIKSLINNTIFSKILGGKINNAREIVEAYLKTSPYKNRDVDIDLFLKVFNDKSAYLSVKSFKEILLAASDINEGIKYVEKFVLRNTIALDSILNLSHKAIILDIKIDVNMDHDEADKLNDKLYNQINKDFIIYNNIYDITNIT